MPPRDLSDGFSYASLGHPHQIPLQHQTRTAMEQQVNPSIISIKNPLTSRDIIASASQEQQRDLNQTSALSPTRIQKMVPDQHMSIPAAVTVSQK